MSEQESVKDRITIGVSSAGDEALGLLVSKKWFASDKDAFLVAIAYALAAKLPPPSGHVSYGTKWNAGSLDPDKRLQQLIQKFSPTDRPYDAAQWLGNMGAQRIAERVRAGEALGDILSDPT